MFRPSNDPTPGPEQVRGLDDEFFASRPLGYFHARIEALLTSADGATANYESGAAQAYAALLRRGTGDFPAVSDRDRLLQVAVDAMTLRQHAAEAVVRLWGAVLEVHGHEPGTVSVWATLTDGKTSLLEVLKQIASRSDIHDDDTAALVLSDHVLKMVHGGGTTALRAATVLFEWLQHAERVLTRDDIHLSAANNKVKHGLAVRVRNDILMSFVGGDAMPDPIDGTIPVSTLRQSTPLVDKPVVDYLARPPKTGRGAPQGLEITTLILDVPLLLAEASMIATVHAAVFHLAATRYVQATGAAIEVAPYPTLPLGPTPEEMLGKRLTGMRSPVTRSANPSAPERGHGLGFEDGTFLELHIDFDQHQAVRAVQD